MNSLSENTRGYLTIIGGVMIHIVNGSIYSFGILSSFMISYLHEFNNSLVPSDAFFLLAFGVFAQSFTVLLGGYMEKKLGPRITMSIGIALILASYLIMYLSKSLGLNYFAICLFGFGVGIDYLCPVRTAMYYFPKKKGLAVGIIVCGFGISASLLNIIITAIVNPNNEKPVNGFYRPEVAENVPKYLLISLIAFSVLSVISVILVCPHENQNKKQVNSTNVNISSDISNQDNNNSDKNLIEENDNEKISDIGKEKDTFKKDFFKAICSKQYWFLFVMIISSSYYNFTILNVLKTYATHYDNLTESLVLLMTIFYSVANGLGRSIWGYLYDILSFKTLFTVLFIIQIINSSTVYFVSSISWLMFIYIVLSGMCLAGAFSLMPVVCSTIFSVKYSSEIYGSLFLAFGISGMVAPVLSKLLNLSTATTTTPYLVIFLVGTGLAVIGLILTLLLDLTTFKYDDDSENKEEETS